MAGKKVVDAEILLDQIQQMSYRTWCSTPYYSGGGYGTNNVEDSMRHTAQLMASQIAANVNAAMSIMITELRTAIMAATRDEDGGMCGLCRPIPGEQMPVDYRPAKSAD